NRQRVLKRSAQDRTARYADPDGHRGEGAVERLVYVDVAVEQLAAVHLVGQLEEVALVEEREPAVEDGELDRDRRETDAGGEERFAPSLAHRRPRLRRTGGPRAGPRSPRPRPCCPASRPPTR